MVSNSLSLRRFIAASALILSSAGWAGAQAPDPDIFYLSANVPAFAPYAAIPLRLGDGFTAGGGKITVKLVGNEADNTGSLYFINPVTGAERFLFTNKTGGQPTVDLGDFPKGAPIVFKYITDLAKKNTYTGANQPGTYNFDGDPALAALAVNHKAMPVSAVAVRNGDKRWAVAGRVDATKVVFGFEDQVGIDPDFNDIVFLVTGVGLDTEIKLSPPV